MNIAVNISALTLRDVDFPDALQRRCQLEGVPPEQVTVELTEGATQHVVRLLDTLTRFRLKGFGVALDDFGTGYSSLSYLRRFPVDKIKLDRSFLQSGDAEESLPIIKAAVTLGHALNLIVVAEGISSIEQERLALEAGCDGLQGYRYAPAMPASAISSFEPLTTLSHSKAA
jgi:EAL domain-containing protein (putative c-di-GMP-specific phosphodiesterase class I)